MYKNIHNLKQFWHS